MDSRYSVQAVRVLYQQAMQDQNTQQAELVRRQSYVELELTITPPFPIWIWNPFLMLDLI
jgi:hypothetical protein